MVSYFFPLNCFHILIIIQLQELYRCCCLGGLVGWTDRQNHISTYKLVIFSLIYDAEDTTCYHITVVCCCNFAL